MSYTADSISVLKGLEPVRHRSGMYTRTDYPQALREQVAEQVLELAKLADGGNSE